MNTDLLYKHWILEECHKMSVAERPTTLADMARRWHDTKFCGYFDEDYITALQEFCRHLVPYGSYPRIYYEYEGYDIFWCLEFIPGTDIIQSGQYRYNKEMKGAPVYPKELEECEEYTDEIGHIEEEYNDKRRQFEDALLNTLPEKDGWTFHRLKYHPISEAEALMSLYALIHPRD